MQPAADIFAPLPIQAVGARLRAARFPADPAAAARRGVCVLLNGQTEFIEKYFEVIDELRGRGFAVASLDWRGQGGSARATDDPRKGYVKDFAEYDEGSANPDGLDRHADARKRQGRAHRRRPLDGGA